MGSDINLLPTKDKQLKRSAKPSQPEQLVEMTKPEDRVFQERVVRVGGVLEFFKRIFKRAPKVPSSKPKDIPDAPVPPPPSPMRASHPVGTVSRLETMADRLPDQPKPAEASTGLFKRIFSRDENPPAPISKPEVATIKTQPVPVPPPPVTQPSVARRPAWGPPPPPIPTKTEIPLVQQVKPDVKPKMAVPPPPPPPPLYREVPGIPRAPSAPKNPIINETTNAPVLGGSGLNVNLVPEEFQAQASTQTLGLAAGIIGAAIVLVLGATFGLKFYESHLKSQSQNLDADLQVLTKATREIEQVELNDAIVLQQRTSDVQRVLSQHIYWDAFFREIEAVTLPSVSYQNMTADINGSISISATTRTFDDVGKQLLAYQNANSFIRGATILSASKTQMQLTGETPPGQEAATQTVVTFTIALQIDPNIFIRK